MYLEEFSTLISVTKEAQLGVVVQIDKMAE
jgi:hypothetical protein